MVALDEKVSPTHNRRMDAGNPARYQGRRETKPFSTLTGERITTANMFHLAPLVCLKFRGRKLVGSEASRTTETALANYVVNSNPEGVDHGLEWKPLLAFAVCYVTSHPALDLVDEQEAEAILNYCEEHLEAAP
jgi:hypothetical protein